MSYETVEYLGPGDMENIRNYLEGVFSGKNVNQEVTPTELGLHVKLTIPREELPKLDLRSIDDALTVIGMNRFRA